jgi:hypothetical protein
MLIKEPEWHHYFSKVPHFTALLKVAGWNRLGDLRNKCGVNKLVRILHNTDINLHVQLFEKYDNEILGILLVEIADEDIIRMMNTLNGEELLFWMDQVPLKKTVKIVNGLGSEQALHVIRKIGLDKSTQLAKGFSASTLITLIQDFAISDLVTITGSLRVALIKKLLNKVKIPGLRIMARFMGIKNSLKMMNQLGELKTFSLLDLLSPEELVLLVRTMHGLKLPRVSAKALHELSMTKSVINMVEQKPAVKSKTAVKKNNKKKGKGL